MESILRFLRSFTWKLCSATLSRPWGIVSCMFRSVWQRRRIFFYVLLHDYVNVCVCNPHSPHYTGHIKNHKQHTADFTIGGFVSFTFSSCSIFGSQTRLTSTFLRKIDDGNRRQWNAPISRYPVAESIATNRDKGLLLLYHSHAHNRYKNFLLIMKTMLDRAHDLSSSWTHFPTNVTVWKQYSHGIPNILLILPSKSSS